MTTDKRLPGCRLKHYNTLLNDRIQWCGFIKAAADNSPTADYRIDDMAFNCQYADIGVYLIGKFREVLYQHAEELARAELGLSNNYSQDGSNHE